MVDKTETRADGFPTGGRKRRGQPAPNTANQGPRKRPLNVVQYMYRNSLGKNTSMHVHQCLQQLFLRTLSSYRLFRTASRFDRRVTCLEWHPNHPGILAAGSKGGDLMLWDYNGKDVLSFLKGMGAGGSITGLRFNPFNHSQVFMTSVAGTISLQDFNGNTIRVYASTEDWDFWFCSVDVSQSRRAVVSGDNLGRVILLDINGKEVLNEKLHKTKVTHVEFNPCCDWLLATASVDHTVKLWDLRNIKTKNSYLHEMPHNKAVNSAYFSCADGSRLLTTDQYDQIRVYSAHDWCTPQRTICHPHRQFQHLTPIKATWHPLLDLIVIGRYPDERTCSGTLRTIDTFDVNSGELVCQLYDPNLKGIVSLNKFSPTGDVLASCMGLHVLIWKSHSMVSDTEDDADITEEVEHERSSTSSLVLNHSHRPKKKIDMAKLGNHLEKLQSCSSIKKPGARVHHRESKKKS